MEIESIQHKGLRKFAETGRTQGLVGDPSRIRKVLAFIDAAADITALAVPPNYGLHLLAGNRAGVWSMTVTKNWRLTFCINEVGALTNLKPADYHAD